MTTGEPATATCLVVGLGAVGQVLALTMQRAGASVSVLARQASAAATAGPFKLQQLRTGLPPRIFDAGPFAVIREEHDGPPPDFIALAVSTPSLAGAWLEALASRAPGAVMIALQPGPLATTRLRAVFPDAQLVVGELGLLAFPAADQRAAHGPRGPVVQGADESVAHTFYYPPMVPTRLAGEAAPRVARLLRRGGMPVRVDPRAEQRATYSSTVLFTLMAALETEGWDMRRLLGEPLIGTLAAAEEALRIATRALQSQSTSRAARRPWPYRNLGPGRVRAAFALGAHIMPVDPARFFERHAFKLRSQTHEWLADQRRKAAALGVPAPQLDRLAAAVTPGVS